MIEPRGTLSPQAPAGTHLRAEDWKLEANCATYTGPIVELPASLCVDCAIRTPCEALWKTMQDELTRKLDPRAPIPYLGGVWGGKPRPEAGQKGYKYPYGTFVIEPCGDDCEAPIHARGACKPHYESQYKRHRLQVRRARKGQ